MHPTSVIQSLVVFSGSNGRLWGRPVDKDSLVHGHVGYSFGFTEFSEDTLRPLVSNLHRDSPVTNIWLHRFPFAVSRFVPLRVVNSLYLKALGAWTHVLD